MKKNQDAQKVCKHCSIEKPVTEFAKHSIKSDGTIYYKGKCLDCKRKYEREYLLNNPNVREKAKERSRKHHLDNLEKANDKSRQYYYQNKDRAKVWSKDYRLRRDYGITLEDYQSMLTSQSSGCAICGATPEEGKASLHVDHDHITGKIRALLCGRCNTTLGRMEENTKLLQRMIDYINKHKED